MDTSDFIFVMLYEEFVRKIVKGKKICIQQPVWRLTLSAIEYSKISSIKILTSKPWIKKKIRKENKSHTSTHLFHKK
jgi:hypothetical protein